MADFAKGTKIDAAIGLLMAYRDELLKAGQATRSATRLNGRAGCGIYRRRTL